MRFLAFDCLVIDDQNVMSKSLDKRYGVGLYTSRRLHMHYNFWLEAASMAVQAVRENAFRSPSYEGTAAIQVGSLGHRFRITVVNICSMPQREDQRYQPFLFRRQSFRS